MAIFISDSLSLNQFIIWALYRDRPGQSGEGISACRPCIPGWLYIGASAKNASAGCGNAGAKFYLRRLNGSLRK